MYLTSFFLHIVVKDKHNERRYLAQQCARHHDLVLASNIKIGNQRIIDRSLNSLLFFLVKVKLYPMDNALWMSLRFLIRCIQ